MEFKKASNYDINITHTINGGIIVKVGCATLCFSSPEDMVDVMKQYYEDPEGMEKLYNSQNGPQDVAYSQDESCDRPSNGAPLAGAGGNALGRTLRGPRNVEEAPDRRR